MNELHYHPTSCIDPGAIVRSGTRIWHFTHVMAGARIGRDCVIGQNCFIGARAVIGDGVKIQNNVSVYDSVTLEDRVFVGPSAVFTNVFNPRAHVERKDAYRPTLVKKGATIGANATIICGVTIGRYAFVGAGAVVTRDVKSHYKVYGVPSQVHGVVCRCGGLLDSTGICPECGEELVL